MIIIINWWGWWYEIETVKNPEPKESVKLRTIRQHHNSLKKHCMVFKPRSFRLRSLVTNTDAFVISRPRDYLAIVPRMRRPVKRLAVNAQPSVWKQRTIQSFRRTPSRLARRTTDGATDVEVTWPQWRHDVAGRSPSFQRNGADYNIIDGSNARLDDYHSQSRREAVRWR